MVVYPSVERIISCNLRVLTEFKVKKADRHEVVSRSAISGIIQGCEDLEGDEYEKAVFLLQRITKAHAFASGNRRTAVLVTKEFLQDNGGEFRVPNEPSNARVLQGIREDFYTREEIMIWLKHGTIRPFTR